MEVVDDRYEVRAHIASGGMGVVDQALDRATGELVALKRLHVTSGDVVNRFLREAQILAGLSHAGIVRHVGHGQTPSGEPYLAMEWLDGEDLGERLARGPLAPHEAVALASHVADALAAAHARGIVHRDIKPNNVYLQHGQPSHPRLVDFGVARVANEATHLTQAGVIIGTPAYMAPEQIRGAPVDQRIDIFALGCVLFECLVGHPPWTGNSSVAIMAKILFEEPPKLGAILPELPDALSSLLGRMLEKDRNHRPSDAGFVAAELRSMSLEPSRGERGPALSRPPASLTALENRLVCVVLAESSPRLSLAADQATMAATAAGPSGLVRIAAEYAARIEVLIDGSIAAVITGGGEATDLAARAAKCALALRAELGPGRITLATGRAVVTDALPTGEAIENAAVLLSLEGDAHGGIRIDEATKALLELRFRIERDGDSAVLVGERGALDEARLLLGKPTPCVGRDAELDALEADFTTCVRESSGRAYVVTGPAGSGKSRVRHELLSRITGRAEVWIARGDPIRQGSPLAMLAQAIRHASGVREGDTLDAAREKLLMRVMRDCALLEARRIAEFLGEICGLQFPDERSLQLKAARQNPMLMADQMRRAFEDLLLSVTRERPVMLVLEDLQWGDLPTVQFVDAALRNAQGRRFFVFATARPEVFVTFPDLWSERQTTRLALEPLSAGASEMLIRAVLGTDVSADTVKRIVELAEGNAFSLEELIRSVAEGQTGELPRSVLAMAQARLESLPEHLRLGLRAASVFGETFWKGGIAALLGDYAGDLDATLDGLVEREIIVRQGDSRFSRQGESEFVFRHSLLREAAYGMLTDDDRSLGHRLAAQWLQDAGERDAVALAQHYDLGGEPARAAEAYARAAEQALEANDLDGVLMRTERAAKCGAKGEALAFLRLLEATAYHWRAEYEKGERAALDALQGLRPLGAAWYRAAEAVAESVLPLAKIGPLVALGDALYPPPGKGGATGAFVTAAAAVSMQLFLAGKYEAAETILQRMEAAEKRFGDPGPLVRAQCHFARATRAMIGGDLGTVLNDAQAAVAAFDEAGDLRGAARMRSNLAYARIEVGAYSDAEQTLRTAQAIAERMGLLGVVAATKQNLGWVLARRGEFEEARSVEAASLALYTKNDERRMVAISHAYMAVILAACGDESMALQHAHLAADAAKNMPPMRIYAIAVQAHVRSKMGQTLDAAEAARTAMAGLEELGSIDEGEAFVRLTFAEAMLAIGDVERAKEALRAANEVLEARAARIADPAWSTSFLERVPENAKIRTLSRQLLQD